MTIQPFRCHSEEVRGRTRLPKITHWDTGRQKPVPGASVAPCVSWGSDFLPIPRGCEWRKKKDSLNKEAAIPSQSSLWHAKEWWMNINWLTVWSHIPWPRGSGLQHAYSEQESKEPRFLLPKPSKGLVSLVYCNFGRISCAVTPVWNFSSGKVCGQDKLPVHTTSKKKAVGLLGGHHLLLWCLWTER